MATLTAERPDGDAARPPKKKRLGLLIAIVAIPLLAGGAAAAYFLVPGLSDKFAKKEVAAEAAKPVAPKAVFIDLPEMSVTLPNGGQPKQLRIRISLELMKADIPPTETLSPRVYDAILTYLRTLTDAEIENSIAIDRLRGDLYRRLSLLLGPDVVRDILITGFVVA